MTATPTPIRPAGYGPRPSFGPHSVIVTVGEFVLVPVPREAVDLARQTADALAELTDARARFTRALEAGEPRERLRGEVDRLRRIWRRLDSDLRSEALRLGREAIARRAEADR